MGNPHFLGKAARPGVIGMSRDGSSMRLVDVSALTVEDVVPAEVCHHLAGILRYGGLPGVGKRVTVAQHTVEGAESCYASVRALRNEQDAALATQHFIVHDWPEAFTGDVRAPLLALPAFAAVRELQAAHLLLCRERMGLDVAPPRWVEAAVAYADKEDARREQRWLLPPHACWGGLEDVRGPPKVVWSEDVAKARLLALVAKFFGGEVLR